MIVITRYTVPLGEADDFVARASAALTALGSRPGFKDSWIGRAADEPTLWTIVTEWEGPGYYRRALSDYDVRMAAVPLLSLAHDEPTAFEVVSGHTSGPR
ncbi:hypothetical protein GCM10009799_17770 [Nocardiopsis rhodophaea]|uniref:ABM domain-containing protein n=1 Tax=Nocardiopsis rhodophaea TaxID=280238 RepID=A0ABP5E7R7_9ACTN